MNANKLNRYVVASAALLSLSFPSFAFANPRSTPQDLSGAIAAAEMANKFKMNVTPFNLVFLGFQGFLSSEDIPPAMSFIRGAKRGTVTPEILVQAAINMNRLSPDVLQDKGYLSSVKRQLNALVQSDHK